MPGVAIIGCQWGDEGKGKVVDFFARDADIVARFNGGPNAGHTVFYQGDSLVFHQIPCGMLNPRCWGIIGSGCLLDISVLKEEIGTLEKKGIKIKDRLFIDFRTHLILPYHRAIDTLREKKRTKIGTTGRGIGPAYEDKSARTGIRVGELKNFNEFSEHLKKNVAFKNFYLMTIYDGEPLNEREILEEIEQELPHLLPLIADTSLILTSSLKAGKKVIFEGAQGTLLDLNYGTYPYVTSSSTTVFGIPSGLGVSPKMIDDTIGVAKAYTTRVGEGPFPTEIKEDLGNRLRERGKEFGATTGRPRRTGWLDLGIIRYAKRLNGFDKLFITKLDVLDEMDEILVADGYLSPSGEISDFDPEIGEELKPKYIKLKGWRESIKEKRKISDLPKCTRTYLDLIAERTGTEIIGISVGEKREETILKDGFNLFS
jgi:adenylosuccinate synthase|uniref:Adenylosuccinate synthetase n=1 Tax=candidate division WOR-3 bacterium TaxID=2052148 RepID=A0A7C3UQC8_UNCW3